MAQVKDSVSLVPWEEVLSQQQDLLRELVAKALQELLEAEMDEALGARNGERTVSRLGYRSGYYDAVW